jgi:hypothetical protein
MTQEPLHATRQDAVRWVSENTDNTVFSGQQDGAQVTVRADANTGTLYRLAEAEDGTFYWSRMHRIN